MFSLKWVGLTVTVFTNTQNATALIINNGRHIETLLSHCQFSLISNYYTIINDSIQVHKTEGPDHDIRLALEFPTTYIHDSLQADWNALMHKANL
jgi:hypothetical protein